MKNVSRTIAVTAALFLPGSRNQFSEGADFRQATHQTSDGQRYVDVTDGISKHGAASGHGRQGRSQDSGILQRFKCAGQCGANEERGSGKRFAAPEWLYLPAIARGQVRVRRQHRRQGRRRHGQQSQGNDYCEMLPGVHHNHHLVVKMNHANL